MSNGNGVFTSNGFLPAVSATGTTDDADGVDASSLAGTGVSGSSTEGVGVAAFSNNATALIVNNENANPAAFIGTTEGIGLYAVGGGVPGDTPPDIEAAIVAQGGSGSGVSATTTDGAAVAGNDLGSGIGVSGGTVSGIGVSATSAGTGTAVFAQAGLETETGPYGLALHAVGPATPPSSPPTSTDGIPPTVFVEGASGGNVGVYIAAQDGVQTLTANGIGVLAIDEDNGIGVSGDSLTGIGVSGVCDSGTAVKGASSNHGEPKGGTATGVWGLSQSGIGVLAQASTEQGVALQVVGKVEVQGNSVGSVTMAAGTKTLTVTNAAATSDSLIFLTPLDNPKAFLWIGGTSAGQFTIDASTALPTKVTIGFLIIN